MDFLAEMYTTAAGTGGANTHEYQVFRNLTQQQLSLKTIDKERRTADEERASMTSMSACLNRTERLAVNALVDKIASEDEEFGNGYLISSIGLLAGAIESMRRPTGFDNNNLTRSTSTQVTIKKSAHSEVFKTFQYDDQTVIFDFELS